MKNIKNKFQNIKINYTNYNYNNKTNIANISTSTN